MKRRVITIVATSMLAASLPATSSVATDGGDHHHDHDSHQHDHDRHHHEWGDPFEPPVAKDQNPAPDVVEVDITAGPSAVKFGTGDSTEVFAYNETVPGPTIEAEVGDQITVHFCNELPPEDEIEGGGDTVVHFHGVEAHAAMDGSNISQEPVAPGECFDYELSIDRAATYWYHSHINSDIQVERGLHGALVVRDPAEDAKLGLPTRDKVLMLDDILLDDDGQIAPRLPEDAVGKAETLLNGREGNTFLVNGETPQTINVRMGKTQRWRLINPSNSRFMRLSFPGLNAWRVGGDAGLIEHPEEIEPIQQVPDEEEPGETISDPDPDKGLLLTPGERAEVVFTPTGRPGQVFEVEWHDFPRGQHNTFRRDDGTIGMEHDHEDGHREPETLVRMRTIGWWPSWHEYEPPETLRPVERIDTTGAKTLSATFGHSMPDPDGNITFFAQMVDGEPRPFDAVTPAEAQDVQVGETAIWEITNMTGGDHPFHAHGFFFQPYEIEYVDMDNPENNRVVPIDEVELKDTVRVPKRPGERMRSRTIVRAAVVFDDTGREGLVDASGKTPSPGESGGWVFHCHVLEHADGGMMSFIEVFDE